VQVVATHDASFHQELFARCSNGSVWYYDLTYGTSWQPTPGSVDTIVAAQVGIAATASGDVYLYQDNTGWIDTHAGGVVQVVVSPGTYPYEEELYARCSNGAVYESITINVYEPFENSYWYFAGEYASSIVAMNDGVVAVSGGDVFYHAYGDGWLDTHAGSVAQVVVTTDASGEKELFAQCTNGSVYGNVVNYWAGVDDVRPSGWFFTGGYVI
jgi:hypothetical protein